MSDIPEYEVFSGATISGVTICWFDCPCGTVHVHGRPDKVGVPEHRAAHCGERATHPDGYMIVWRGR